MRDLVFLSFTLISFFSSLVAWILFLLCISVLMFVMMLPILITVVHRDGRCIV